MLRCNTKRFSNMLRCIIAVFSILIANIENTYGIIGDGIPVHISEVPYHATIFQVKGDFHNRCGGSIITVKHILTAAHCFERDYNPARIHVRVNSSDGFRYENELLNASRIFAYYGKVDKFYDIAIVELEHPLTLSKNVQIVQIAEDSFEKHIGERGFVFGYSNINSQLQYVDLKIVRKKYCSPYLVEPLNLLTNLFCGFNQNSSTPGGCLHKGDSGSALMINNKQYGIQSRANGDGKTCDDVSFAMFTDVSKFKDFITSVTGRKFHVT